VAPAYPINKGLQRTPEPAKPELQRTSKNFKDFQDFQRALTIL
jgi:hypothetical protein